MRARRCVACGCVVALYRCSQASFFSSLRGQKHRQLRVLAPLLSAHQRSVCSQVCLRALRRCLQSNNLPFPFSASSIWLKYTLAHVATRAACHSSSSPDQSWAGQRASSRPDSYVATNHRLRPLARPCQPHHFCCGCRCEMSMCVLADLARHAHTPHCRTHPLTLHCFPCGTRTTAFLSWRMTF